MRRSLRIFGCLAIISGLVVGGSIRAGASSFRQTNPTSFKIVKGAIKGGSVNSLTAFDGDKITIHSARKVRKNPHSSKIVSWIVEFDGVLLSSNDNEPADFEWSGDAGQTIKFSFVDPATHKQVAEPFTTTTPTDTDDQELLSNGTLRPFVDSNNVLKIQIVSTSKKGFVQGTDVISFGYTAP